MTAPHPTPPAGDGPLAAGRLGPWLVEVADAITGRGTAAVPCDGCTECCTASQFIPIGPDETDTLARVPAGLAVEAPGRPGWRVLGYDEHGRCPMLVDGACSIYDVRPRTCRTYDCRVFAATGVTPADDQPGITARAARWRFELTDADDPARSAALAAAAAHVRARAGRPVDDDPGHGVVPTHPTQLAVLAVEVHEAFLATDPDTGALAAVEAPASEVAVALRRALAPRRVDGAPGRARRRR